jgi:hypothetical protein
VGRRARHPAGMELSGMAWQGIARKKMKEEKKKTNKGRNILRICFYTASMRDAFLT